MDAMVSDNYLIPDATLQNTARESVEQWWKSTLGTDANEGKHKLARIRLEATVYATLVAVAQEEYRLCHGQPSAATPC